MRKNIILSFAVLSLFGTAALMGGCGSAKKEGQSDVLTPNALANAAHLGNENCLQCHNAGQDLTMVGSGDGRTIGDSWRNSLHHSNINGTVTVDCEDCHGGGQFHFGLGPLPNPVPQADVCLTCHGNPQDRPAKIAPAVAAVTARGQRFEIYTGYLRTEHANANGIPDKNFSQIPTPVSTGQHIQECSVCHDNNQRFVFDANANLSKPDPNNLPTPQVACASCHDAHEVGRLALVASRPAGTNPNGNVAFPIFRKQQTAGHGTFGTPEVKPTTGFVTTTEQICAACHTKSTYIISNGVTHQVDVFSQWSSSAHSDTTAAGWRKIPNTAANYPFDISKGTLTTNAASGNTDCYKCHNGLAAPNYMNDLQGTLQADVIWGGATATCVTCHDPHKNASGTTDNVRVPIAMSRYSSSTSFKTGATFNVDNPLPQFRLKFDGRGTFLDRSPLPANNGNSTVCIFCHQGRQSGYTLFKLRIEPAAVEPRVLTTNTFFNPHYLGTAAMLWGVNAYEYPSKQYSVNTAHQQQNCTGCHMGNATTPVNEGGHTWRPNPATCTPCHSNFTPGIDLEAALDADANAIKIQQLQTKLIQLFAANGIFYDDTQNPYFFAVGLTADKTTTSHATNIVGSVPASNTQFRNWTPQALKAAFNLAFVVKGLPGEGAEPAGPRVQLLDANGAPTGIFMPATTQTDNPNRSAAVHNFQYAIQLLTDSFNDYLAVAPVKAGFTAIPDAERPAGTRAALNYDTLTRGGTYNPLQ